MSPKEKAKELVDRFNLPSGLMSIERKQCALIAVDEIVATLNKEVYPRFQYDDTFEYWENVKNEIELL